MEAFGDVVVRIQNCDQVPAIVNELIGVLAHVGAGVVGIDHLLEPPTGEIIGEIQLQFGRSRNGRQGYNIGKAVLGIPGEHPPSVIGQVAIEIMAEDFRVPGEEKGADVRGNDVGVGAIVEHGEVCDGLVHGRAGVVDGQFLAEIVPVTVGALTVD